jgi:hypothetical protein
MSARVQAFGGGRRSTLAPILGLAVIALTAGCGGEDPGIQAAAALDACSILPVQDVTAVLGAGGFEAEAERRGDNDFWASSCRYQAQDEDEPIAASLMVRPHHSKSGAEQAYADYDSELASQLGEEARLSLVEGLGQKAGWQDFGTSVGQLTVFQGPYQLIITAPSTAGHDQLHNCRALAERALARLSSG